MIDQEYENIFWPQLREALDILLVNQTTPGTENDISDFCVDGRVATSCQRISFEQMYSAVYKCVCNQYSERLYNDLISHVDYILQR